jgi:hypothetical protein
MKIRKVKVGGGIHPLITCVVNGKKENAIVDSGANVTIDICPDDGKYRPSESLSIKIGDREYVRQTHNTMSNLNIEVAYKKAKIKLPRLIIGMDILDKAVIDLNKNILTLH